MGTWDVRLIIFSFSREDHREKCTLRFVFQEFRLFASSTAGSGPYFAASKEKKLLRGNKWLSMNIYSVYITWEVDDRGLLAPEDLTSERARVVSRGAKKERWESEMGTRRRNGNWMGWRSSELSIGDFLR